MYKHKCKTDTTCETRQFKTHYSQCVSTHMCINLKANTHMCINLTSEHTYMMCIA